MWIAFVLRARGASNGEHPNRIVAGASCELAILREDGDGPFYPHVIEEESNATYRFFAGRIIGHSSRTVPNAAPFSASAKAEPDGSWIGLEFDRANGTVRIASDLFNQQRWFYGRIGQQWVFANSLRCLQRVAAPRPQIDERAIPYMLRMGYLPEPFTPLRDVFSLGSGMQLEVGLHESKLSSRSKLPVHRRNLLSGEEHGEHVAQTLVDEVTREITGLDHVWIPLSGGVDSRFLLACALESLAPEAISTVTFGSAHSLDARIGSALAKMCGVKNLFLPMDDRPLNAILDHNFAVSEGLYWTVPDYPVGPFNDALPANAVALSGYVGDPVFGSKEGKLSSSEPAAGREAELIRTYWKAATYAAPSDVMALCDLNDDDPLHVRDIYRAIVGSTMMESFDYFYFGQHSVNRTLYAVTPARHKAFYVMPFISRAVLDCAFAIPGALRHSQRAYFAALKARFPEFYAFPTTRNHGYPIANRRSFPLLLTRAHRRMMRELDERLGESFGWHVYHNPRANYAHPRELLRRKHREAVLEGLARLDRVSLIKRGALHAVKQRVVNGKGVDPQLLRGLLTVSQWVEVYGNQA
ncbi:MAG: hypothetical protein IPG71_03665 [bacterium]|nr:hypothetical protein [bacterium]